MGLPIGGFDREPPVLWQMPVKRIGAKHQGEFDMGKMGEQAFAPCSSTLGPGRHVSLTSSLPDDGAGEAKPHWQYGKTPGIVEGRLIYTKPMAKPVTTGIIERSTFLMGFGTRCLTGDKDFGAACGLQYGFGPKRQALTYMAGPHFFKQYRQRLHQSLPAN